MLRPRFREAQRIYGVHLNGTEHPRRSLGGRSLIVCFVLCPDRHLDLKVARNVPQEPYWETSFKPRIHSARCVSVHRPVSDTIVTYGPHCNNYVLLPFGEHSQYKTPPDSRVESRNRAAGTRSTCPVLVMTLIPCLGFNPQARPADSSTLNPQI